MLIALCCYTEDGRLKKELEGYTYDFWCEVIERQTCDFFVIKEATNEELEKFEDDYADFILGLDDCNYYSCSCRSMNFDIDIPYIYWNEYGGLRELKELKEILEDAANTCDVLYGAWKEEE